MTRSIKLIVLSLFFCLTFLYSGNCSDELTEAIKNNDVRKVKTFIEADPALVDKELPYRSYPLHEAISLLKTDIG